MSLSTTEIIGLCEQFIQLLQNYKTELKAKGLDVTDWIENLENQKNDVVTIEGERDSLKAAAKVKTTQLQTAGKGAYKTVSTMVDAVVGVLGKDTPAAKETARLRSSLLPQPKKKKDEPKNS